MSICDWYQSKAEQCDRLAAAASDPRLRARYQQEGHLCGTVDHAYARRDFEADPDATQWQESVHTNSAEGYFSIFKRGMKGIYQHCGEKHLHRYLAEYDHRYNHRTALGYSDIDRTIAAIKGVAGKRLMYKQPH